MRREGFEMQVSAPEVIYKKIDGVKYEPIEYLVVDIPDRICRALSWNILGKKKAEMKNMVHYGDRVRIEFEVPSRVDYWALEVSF